MQIDLPDACSQNSSLPLGFLRHPIATIHATNTDKLR